MSAIVFAIPLLDDSIEQVDIAGFIRHGDYVTAFRDTHEGTAPCSPSRWSPGICDPSCSTRSPPPSPPTPWPTSPRMARSRADSPASSAARPHGGPALRTGRGVTGRLRRGRAPSRPARHRGGRRCRPSAGTSEPMGSAHLSGHTSVRAGGSPPSARQRCSASCPTGPSLSARSRPTGPGSGTRPALTAAPSGQVSRHGAGALKSPPSGRPRTTGNTTVVTGRLNCSVTSEIHNIVNPTSPKEGIMHTPALFSEADLALLPGSTLTPVYPLRWVPGKYHLVHALEVDRRAGPDGVPCARVSAARGPCRPHRPRQVMGRVRPRCRRVL